MSGIDSSREALEARVLAVVQRLLRERSIHREVSPEDDLREAGLTSLDMVSLVFSVENEFNLLVPETSIAPANFRSVSAIARLLGTLIANG